MNVLTPLYWNTVAHNSWPTTICVQGELLRPFTFCTIRSHSHCRLHTSDKTLSSACVIKRTTHVQTGIRPIRRPVRRIRSYPACIQLVLGTVSRNKTDSAWTHTHLQGCWYVLSPTRKETSYSDRRFWCSYILLIIIIEGISVPFIYITRLASKEIFSPSNKIHREVVRAKNLSAPRQYQDERCKFYI